MLFYVCDLQSLPVEDKRLPNMFDNTLLKVIFVLNQHEATGGNVTRMRYTVHCSSNGARGSAVVEALRYKPECRGIDSRWCHWNFSLT
jgi:hypothetical protein